MFYLCTIKENDNTRNLKKGDILLLNTYGRVDTLVDHLVDVGLSYRDTKPGNSQTTATEGMIDRITISTTRKLKNPMSL